MSPPRLTADRGFLTVAMLLGLLAATVPLSVDPTLPGMPQMALSFGVDAASVQYSLSAFMVGIAGGQLLIGPLSDNLGRRPVLLAGLTLFVVAVIGCAVSQSITVMIVLRLLQGIGVCAAAVIARAIVRDLYQREDAARMYATMMMIHGVAPILGPIMGAQLTLAFGWRAVFWFLAVYGVVTLFTIWRALGETIPERNPEATRPRVLIRTYGRLLSSRLFVGYMLTMSGCYAGLFAFLSASASTLITQFGVSISNYSYLFALCMACYVTGSWVSAKLVGRLSIAVMIITGAIVIAAAGITMAALGFARVDLAVAIVAPMAVFMLAFALIVPPAQAAAMAVFPDIAGAASSVLGCVQLAVSALTGLIVGQFADGTQLPMVTALCVASLLPGLIYFTVVRPAA